MKNENYSITYDILKSILYQVVFIVIILAFVCRLAVVDGSSMSKTLEDNDVVLVTNYQSYFNYIPQLKLKQGDVVAVAPDKNSDNQYKVDNAFIKRVIAVEGQTIGFDEENSKVYVDGKIIDEPYLSSETFSGVDWDIPDVIPPNKVFVMGDNRAVSVDSRSVRIQLVDEKNIIGKVQFIVYPFDKLSYIYE
ncbi:MAG: signal peptidase I [Acutalibacteraceae bacterium]